LWKGEVRQCFLIWIEASCYVSCGIDDLGIWGIDLSMDWCLLRIAPRGALWLSPPTLIPNRGRNVISNGVFCIWWQLKLSGLFVYTNIKLCTYKHVRIQTDTFSFTFSLLLAHSLARAFSPSRARALSLADAHTNNIKLISKRGAGTNTCVFSHGMTVQGGEDP